METNGAQSPKPETIYGFCPWCGHEIQPGEPAVTLWLQVEQQAPEATPIPEVDVLDSAGVIALCRGCGDALDGDELRRMIHEHYRGEPKQCPHCDRTNPLDATHCGGCLLPFG